MPSSSRGESRVETLANRLELLVTTDPTAAFRLARDIVARERAHRVLEPALDVLLGNPILEIRAVLRERFDDLTENGMRYDQDCALRIRIVQVLRAIGSPEDLDLAERGVRLIQLNPPARVDVAQALRGQCLLLMSDVAPERAQYFAVELLQDPHLSSFSGEPAVTAIQVLAGRANILPIWALARRTGSPPDVLAQAFASMRGTPPDLQLDALSLHLKDAAERGENGEGVALVAAEAIVLNRLAGGYSAVVDLLQETTNFNLFHYLVITAARGGDDGLRERLRELGDRLKDPRKAGIIAETLGTGRRP
jgi:hypothetical protein